MSMAVRELNRGGRCVVKGGESVSMSAPPFSLAQTVPDMNIKGRGRNEVQQLPT